jgi:hypothetical protein
MKTVEDVKILLVFYKILQPYPSFVRFEIFTEVTMRNGVFWDVTPCASC